MNNYIISEFLHAHPAPWHTEEDGMASLIEVSTGKQVENALTPAFAEFVVALVNQRHANCEVAEVVAGEIEAKFEELRRERDSANVNLNCMIDAYNGVVAQRDNMEVVMLAAQQDKADLRSEMTELHTIISAQRALIDGLQRRLDRLEERA